MSKSVRLTGLITIVHRLGLSEPWGPLKGTLHQEPAKKLLLKSDFFLRRTHQQLVEAGQAVF
jgi:hypothetical protein